MPGPRTAKYPKQIVLMVSTDVYDLINHLSLTENLRKTEILRTFLYAGIRKAGYSDVLMSDGPTLHLEDIHHDTTT